MKETIQERCYQCLKCPLHCCLNCPESDYAKERGRMSVFCLAHQERTPPRSYPLNRPIILDCPDWKPKYPKAFAPPEPTPQTQSYSPVAAKR